ncbi:MAG: YncE family protein [Candidatus Dormiibacterota bacterium]
MAVGANPVAVAVDYATNTVYVGNGNDGTVSVINGATCNASHVSGCGQTAPTITVGSGPVDDAVDQRTDTVYVTNLGSNTISVIDGDTCNAHNHSGCHRTPPTIMVGNAPDGVAIDEATHTVYVANVADNTVSVINGATCNARVTWGCGQVPPTVAVGVQPAVPAVDEATDTVYVPNSNPGGPGSVSVIDGATCNASVTTGCGNTPPSVAVGVNTFPVAAAVDQATDTVYETVYGPSTGTTTTLGSVDVIDGATCNASVTSGCGQTPKSVTVGSDPIGVVVNPITESVFVLNEEDSTVSVIDGAICNAAHAAGCSQHPPDIATGFNPGYLDVDLATDTVYASNQGQNDVSVLDGAACTLTHPSGCRKAAPTTTVGAGPAGIAVDAATHTVYVTSQNDDTLSVINGATCNASVRSACGRNWPTVSTGTFPQAVAIDQRTRTVYVANLGANTVSVINGATCNAINHSGCSQIPATIAVGGGPWGLAVNFATDTVYVANWGGGSGDTVSVIDGATCNATNHSGCGQTPPTVSVGGGPVGVAVDQATDTVYVANSADTTVSVIDGVSCNATNHSGCGQNPPTISVGSDPVAIAVNQATHTVYVAKGFFTGALSASVSVIDAATCNAIVTTGCGQTPAMMVTGGVPFDIAVAEATDTVYVSSIIDSTTDVFNGATCNASVSSGCGQDPVSVPTGGWSSGLGVNLKTDTVYVADNTDGEVSFFRAGMAPG